ncbi:MAG: hypothetical protein HXX09_13235 [Bacteroidetes bacterium]|nr:hypothetical protein [Bacteroidota bacterium]
MKIKLFLFTALIFFLLSAVGCKEKEKPTFNMPQEFKDYVIFPIGSYWIYQDSISGAIDSTNLQSRTSTMLDDNNFPYICEYIIEQVYHSYNNYTNHNSGKINDYISNYSENNSYVYLQSDPIFISNVDIGVSSGNLKYEKFYNSLFIKNTTFKDVKVFSSNESIGNIEFLRTYYSRFVGLIKLEYKEISSNNLKVWELKKYHIN